MPEGPEIRRAADRIGRVLVGRTLSEVYFGLERLKPFEGMLRGATVETVTTHGKAMLTHFANGLTLYSHNQLYGRWYVCRRGRTPATTRTLRVGLHTAAASALLFSASDIDVLPRTELQQHPFLSRLGPDVLDDSLAWRDVAGDLTRSRFAGRSLAALYLDQHFLAGIGNYLRSEILFAAGLHPWLRPRDLTRGQIGRLARSTLEISRRAYATAGITNRPRRVRRLQRQGATRRDYRFAVFARAGLPCYDCGTTIQRASAGSRRIYFCPACQARPDCQVRPDC
ncbi:MAG: endonuclease VIII [Anaerolineae bacterium]